MRWERDEKKMQTTVSDCKVTGLHQRRANMYLISLPWQQTMVNKCLLIKEEVRRRSQRDWTIGFIPSIMGCKRRDHSILATRHWEWDSSKFNTMKTILREESSPSAPQDLGDINSEPWAELFRWRRMGDWGFTKYTYSFRNEAFESHQQGFMRMKNYF